MRVPYFFRYWRSRMSSFFFLYCSSSILYSRSAFLSFSFCNKYSFRFFTSSSRSLHILRAYRAQSPVCSTIFCMHFVCSINSSCRTSRVFDCFRLRLAGLWLFSMPSSLIPRSHSTWSASSAEIVCCRMVLDSSGDPGGEGCKLGWLTSGEADGGGRRGRPNADPVVLLK